MRLNSSDRSKTRWLWSTHTHRVVIFPTFRTDLEGISLSSSIFLLFRVHELEEQVKDAETRADQTLEGETKRHLEAYHKLERDCNLEIDLLCNR